MKNKGISQFEYKPKHEVIVPFTNGELQLDGFDQVEFVKSLEGSNIIAIEGKVKDKFFRVDGQVVKVTNRINDIPFEGINEQGELVQFLGKFLEAVKILRELWFIIKRFF